MVRKDKKNRKCICCEKTLASPQKLRQHYKSNKNQCTSNQPSHSIASPQLPEQVTVPQDIDQGIDQENDPEAGPDLVTKANREGQAIIPRKPPSHINIEQFKTVF